MKFLIALSLLVFSLTATAATVMISSSTGPSQYAPITNLVYKVSTGGVSFWANGKNEHNQSISCIVNFPMEMKDYAFDIYNLILRKQNTTNFTLTCHNPSLGSSNYTTIKVGGSNPQGSFAISSVKR